MRRPLIRLQLKQTRFFCCNNTTPPSNCFSSWDLNPPDRTSHLCGIRVGTADVLSGMSDHPPTETSIIRITISSLFQTACCPQPAAAFESEKLKQEQQPREEKHLFTSAKNNQADIIRAGPQSGAFLWLLRINNGSWSCWWCCRWWRSAPSWRWVTSVPRRSVGTSGFTCDPQTSWTTRTRRFFV